MPVTSPYPDFLGSEGIGGIDNALGRIVDCLIEGRNVSFLFGAGMSISAGFPSGASLGARMVRKFIHRSTATAPIGDADVERVATRYPLEAIASAVALQPGGRPELTSFLKSLYLDDTKEPRQEHKDFVAICNNDGDPTVSTVFTTNYDLLLERAFGDQAVTINEDNTPKIETYRHAGRIPVVHLHGTLTGDKSYQITEDDVYQGTNDSRLLQVFQHSLYNADAFVFVGFSMTDPDFLWIYRNYRRYVQEREAASKLTYFVSPAADPSHYLLGKHVWESRDGSWVPLDGATFFANLRRVYSMSGEQKKEDTIMARHGFTKRDLDDAVEKIMQIFRLSERHDAIQYLLGLRPKSGGAK